MEVAGIAALNPRTDPAGERVSGAVDRLPCAYMWAPGTIFSRHSYHNNCYGMIHELSGSTVVNSVKHRRMSDYPTLPNTPIREAILDFRFSMESEVTEPALQSLASQIKVDGWLLERRETQSTKIAIAPSKPLAIETSQPSLQAFVVKSEDATRAYQLRPSSCSVSHMQPYVGWDTFQDDAKTLFDAYAAVAKPEAVSRIAARFINVVEIPQDRFDLDDWFNYAPKLPESTKLVFTSFAQELKAVHPGSGLRTNIKLSNRTSITGHQIILDIDVYATGAFPVEFSKLLNTLEEIRNLKNECFFSYLKAPALKRYSEQP